MEQEDKSVYAHSHSHKIHGGPCDIKALYIDENASLVIEDKGKIWKKEVIRPEDDGYLRLLKEIFVKYEQDSINHLMVGIEALFINSETQASKWNYWHLIGKEGEIKDFCSKPKKFPESFTCTQKICIYPASIIAKAENDKTVSPDKFKSSYPKLSWINTKFISPTWKGYPHSEIQALNALFDIDYVGLFRNIPKEKNTLQALVFKFYSFNDICDDCQSAIQEFIPNFHAALKEQLGMKDENRPITFVGLASHCYSSSHYCSYMEEKRQCVKFNELKTSESLSSLSSYLKEGTCWESLEPSKYNPCAFDVLRCKDYKPFSGNIPLTHQIQTPALYIYVKQPTIEGLEQYINPEELKIFGISVKNISEMIHPLEEKQKKSESKKEVK